MTEREDNEPVTELYGLCPVEAPWGDYGHMLYHGMSDWRDSRREALPLERTGPFVPPISFPSGISGVVTDKFKKEIEAQGFSGVRFKRVKKKKIVKLNWHEWNLKAKRPEKYPPGGEPENYIDGRKHNETLSRQMGDLWELIPVAVQDLVFNFDNREISDLGQYEGQDICLPATRWLPYGIEAIVSPCFKTWMEENAGDWVTLKRVYPAKPRSWLRRLFRR